MRERDPLCADSVASRDAEIGVWLNASELGALAEAVEERRDLGAALGARTVVILAPENET